MQSDLFLLFSYGVTVSRCVLSLNQLHIYANMLTCIWLCMCRNIVSTVNLACPLDLKAIALQARNAEYNPKVGLI